MTIAHVLMALAFSVRETVVTVIASLAPVATRSRCCTATRVVVHHYHAPCQHNGIAQIKALLGLCPWQLCLAALSIRAWLCYVTCMRARGPLSRPVIKLSAELMIFADTGPSTLPWLLPYRILLCHSVASQPSGIVHELSSR